MTVNANVTVGNPDLTHLPTAEEYALFREAYAETYPVRPLMNAIDAQDAEIRRLRAALERIVSMSCISGYDSGHAGIEEVAREALKKTT